MARVEKHAKIEADPQPKKIPKWERDPKIGTRQLSWRFCHVDRDGPFSWALLTDAVAYREAVEKLHEYETKNWAEILRSGSHSIGTDKLSKEARGRLSEIELDDIDELMSFRLTGAHRIWCHFDDAIMRVLWWDPEHKVYPVARDRADRKKKKRKQ